MDLNARLTQAAHEAGKKLLEMQGYAKLVSRTSTAADRASQAHIVSLVVASTHLPILMEEQDQIEEMRHCYPHATFLQTEDILPSDFVAIDPNDGTHFFLHGFPTFGISIAVIRNGLPQLAVLHQPTTGLLITAERGEGCYVHQEGRKSQIRLSQPDNAYECIVGIHNNQSTSKELADKIYHVGRSFHSYVHEPLVASQMNILMGRTIGHVTANARIWDVAGGILCLQEAGGSATLWNGQAIEYTPSHMPPLILAATPAVGRLIGELLETT
jgi:fructose-1,6-bisphosphatase/inositol monophosphatase family enzyme